MKKEKKNKQGGQPGHIRERKRNIGPTFGLGVVHVACKHGLLWHPLMMRGKHSPALIMLLEVGIMGWPTVRCNASGILDCYAL